MNHRIESKRSVRFLSAGLLATLFLALTACAPIQKPRADLRNVALVRVDLSGLDFRLDFDVFNPNAFGLPLRRVAWSVDLFGTHLGDGAGVFNQLIPANGSTHVNVPLSLGYQGIVVVVDRISRGENIPYAISGSIHFETNFGAVTVPFSASGVLANPFR